MSGRPNQRPPDLTRDDLPAWASRALGALEDAHRDGLGRRTWKAGERWDIPEHGLTFFPNAAPAGVLWALLALLWPVGMALLCWALLSLRSDEVAVERWVGGGVMTVAGAVGLARLGRWLRGVSLEGLLVAREGLIVAGERGRFRVVARAEIHDVALEQGELVAVYGPERRRWRHYSARPGTARHRVLESRIAALRAWRQAGAPSPPAEPGEPLGRPARKRVRGVLAASAAALVFLWVVAVLPMTSAGGRAASRFVDHVARRDFDAAYAMLSRGARSRLSRAELEGALPAPLKAATGFAVTGMSGGLGAALGRHRCVHGSLEGAGGSVRAVHAFELVTEAGEPRIDLWREGRCLRAR